MRRRNFLQYTSGAAALAALPSFKSLDAEIARALTPIPSADRKALADAALNAARAAGATYADARLNRYLSQSMSARDGRISSVFNSESYGCGVRVIANGTWGFAATNDLTPDGVARTAREAVAIARANARLQTEPVQLAPVPGYGEVTWKTPIEKNPFEVPLSEKADLLMAASAAALGAGARFVNAGLRFVNEQRYFASTEGTYADQDIHRQIPSVNVTVTDSASGRFQSRSELSAPMGMGWEYLSGRPAGKHAGPGTLKYGTYYDMVEDAGRAPEHAREKLAAKSVTPGNYTLVLDPSHLWLTIHESVGHPLELDRVLGYEANYAGTSFATLDKWRSKSFNYGSPIVNFVADRTQPHSLAAAGWDDEGVKCKEWMLVKDGILVDYECIRDQAHVLGKKESDGCCHADDWASIQFQRMPNVSLQPGKTPMTPEEMIAGVDSGIYIVGDSSYSIDQQRYNFQFSGQLFYEIKGGRITGMLRDVAYQANTQQFWNSCSAICDRRDYRMGGSFNDGKGEPGQVSPVSHGCSTSRFDDITVINTARTI
jgi:TldD protein